MINVTRLVGGLGLMALLLGGMGQTVAKADGKDWRRDRSPGIHVELRFGTPERDRDRDRREMDCRDRDRREHRDHNDRHDRR